MDKINIKYQISNTKNTNQKQKNIFAFLICVFYFWFLIFGFLLVIVYPREGFCDILRLKEIPQGKEGNEVEILEEREDSFIIKVPKEEIEVIKRKRPTEIKAWQEKRILWEDTGDYITLYLPKEKIVLPKGYTGEEYDTGKVLEEKLKSTGLEGRPPEAIFWKGTGRIIGRVVRQGQGLSGVKLKVVNVSYQGDLVSKLLEPKDKRPEDLELETASNELGDYEFKSVPLGEYDIYMSPPGSESWYRRLSEKPNITVRPGETVRYPDIEIK